ncbi:MAG TPA: M24 family metallopeptidase [Candidatus Acidoferrales bacterium]|nr:M24 family metallopeptidase [Candidatus Acidoferrales bacterium]
MTEALVLFASHADADFLYASRFAVEQGLYLRFEDGEDQLLVPDLELDRAVSESSARRILSLREAGWSDASDPLDSWIGLCRRQLLARGTTSIRVSSHLPAGHYQALLDTGLTVRIDPELFVADRRAKSDAEADLVAAAQGAAEAACVEVARGLLASRVGLDGLLWRGDQPLTSEWLMARAQGVLGELGYNGSDMIVAGSPGSAQPHFKGHGQIAAAAPVVVDIFPVGAQTHFCGDLTRTMIVGEIQEVFQAMHDACLAAADESIRRIRPGVDGRAIHHACCRTLVERGFGTTTPGFEGSPAGPIMNHSLGHGVGLEVHEAPFMRNREYPLRDRDVVTVEPGLYQAGLGGVRVEDTGIVREGGFQNFSSLPRSLKPEDYL